MCYINLIPKISISLEFNGLKVQTVMIFYSVCSKPFTWVIAEFLSNYTVNVRVHLIYDYRMLSYQNCFLIPLLSSCVARDLLLSKNVPAMIQHRVQLFTWYVFVMSNLTNIVAETLDMKSSVLSNNNVHNTKPQFTDSCATLYGFHCAS